MKDKTDYIHSGEAARILRVHTDTLVRWCKEGKVKAEKTSAGWRIFKRQDIEALARSKNNE